MSDVQRSKKKTEDIIYWKNKLKESRKQHWLYQREQLRKAKRFPKHNKTMTASTAHDVVMNYDIEHCKHMLKILGVTL